MPRPRGYDDRRVARRCAAGSFPRGRRVPVRLLYPRPDHEPEGALHAQRDALGRGDRACGERKPVPLRRVPQHRARRTSRRGPQMKRIEGPDKVRGRAKYACDIRLEGQLHARVLRSPLPHARIRRIDVSRAQALPGVRAVLCSANAPDIEWYEKSRLFDRTVRFVGDEVAAVAADSIDIAEDALRVIEVDYEPLAFTTDLDDGERGEAQVKRRGDLARGL